jgi:SynChlorMet cassette protein ScmC
MTATAHKAAGYNLTLADGTRWFLTTRDVELRPWLDQLAGILRLKRGAPQDARQLLVVNAAPAQSAGSGTGASSAQPAHAAGRRDADRSWSRAGSSLPGAWQSSDGLDFAYTFPAAMTHDADLRLILMWDALGPVYLQAIMAGGLPLHAALAEVDGRGVLFAAAGGVGKSTCTRRLPAPWKAHCDDTALVVRLPDGGYRVHPFPTWTDHLWRGLKTTWPAQQHMPLVAIFFLEQAGHDTASALPPGAAALRMLRSTSQLMKLHWKGLPRAQKRRVTTAAFHNACALAKAIPAFTLHLTLTGRFWEEVQKALRAASV